MAEPKGERIGLNPEAIPAIEADYDAMSPEDKALVDTLCDYINKVVPTVEERKEEANICPKCGKRMEWKQIRYTDGSWSRAEELRCPDCTMKGEGG